MFSMKILVVVLNYNGAEETSACLDALSHQTMKSDLYLVENSDQDKQNQIKILQEAISRNKLPLAKLDIQQKNTGFAGGVNLGIAYALREKYDAVALLNSDAIPDKNWLKYLSRNLANWDAVTGLMVDSLGNKIINTGDIYTMWGVPEQRDEGLEISRKSSSGEVFGATGGAVIYKTEIFREIGLFDEKLFAYDEDVDIAWRARLAGFRFYYDSEAIVMHEGGTSSSSAFKTRQVFANLPVVAMKNIPSPMIFAILPRFVLAYLMFFVYKITKLEMWSALCGIGRSIRFWPHNLYERHKVMTIFREKFSDKPSQKKQLRTIKSLINPRLPFKQIQRLKNLLSIK